MAFLALGGQTGIRVGDRVGNYRILRQLGEGGMGVVFEAEHMQIGHHVAIKVLYGHYASKAESAVRFFNEARAANRVRHPGIVQVFDHGQLPDGAAYLAMEYLPGESLWERLERQRLAVPDSLRISRQIAAAMAAAHAAGIIHRDLKPGNVILVPDSEAPGGERAKILDFGIAKLTKTTGSFPPQQGTREGVILGTARYMAPEQCRGIPIDDKVDVYALGVMLYEMLAGEPPFVANSDAALLYKHLSEAPPSLDQRVSNLPGQLASLVHTMLAKEAHGRPPMRDVALLLGDFTDGAAKFSSGSRPITRSDLPDTVEACPFPGLLPFSEDLAGYFCGRDEDISRVCALLGDTEYGHRRWLQIEGPSGAGKSSLVRAGLLPALRTQRLRGPSAWQVVFTRPGRDPIYNLALTLSTVLDGPGGVFSLDRTRALLAEEDGLRNIVRRFGQDAPGRGLLLVLDQMEEGLTLVSNEALLRLDALVAAALNDTDGPLYLCTTLRSDFLSHMHRLPRMEAALNHASRYHLRPMDEDSILEVLLGSVQRAGLRFEAGLFDRVASDVVQSESGLPLLSHLLRELWQRRKGDLLTMESYEALAGVGGALARSADELLRSLGPDGRNRARRLLLGLVRSSRGAAPTRRPMDRLEALACAGDGPAADQVLLRLSGGRDPQAPLHGPPPPRLVVVDEERVDLIHEALLTQWETLRSWVEADRKALERRDDLETAAQAWSAAGCPSDGLPDGVLLSYYEGAGLDVEVPHSLLGGRFLEAAREHARRTEEAARWQIRDRLRRQRLLISVLSVGLATSLGLLGLAFQQHQKAEARLKDALGVADQIVDTMDKKLQTTPGTAAARRELLWAGYRLIDRLLQGARQSEAVMERKLRNQIARSDLAIDQGDIKNALPEAKEAERLARELLRRDPRSKAHRKALVQCKDILGGLFLNRLGNPVEARAAYTEALAIEEGLLAEAPDDYETGRRVATYKFMLAEALRQGDDLPGAEAAYSNTIAHSRAYLKTHPDDAGHRFILERALQERCRIALAGKNLPVARAAVDELVPAARASLRAQPQNTRRQINLVNSDYTLSEVAMAEGRMDEARKAGEEALGLIEPLALAEPTRIDYQVARVRTHWALARVEAAAGHGELSRGYLIKPLPMLEELVKTHPDRPRYRLLLAQHLREMSRTLHDTTRLKEAEALLQALLAAEPENRTYRKELDLVRQMPSPSTPP